MALARIAVLFAVVLWLAPDARAEADGPDFWRVTGVARSDELNMHTGPAANTRIIARIPSNARGLKSLGCKGGPTFAQWQKMSPAERERGNKLRWCKVVYNGRSGWVAGRFLAEDGPPPQARPAADTKAATFGAWSVRCDPACRVEQTGIGTPRATRLLIEPDSQNNARITILRANVPASGTVTIYMDGDMISAGPLAQLRAKDGNAIVMEPGDITQGLLRQMARHKNMVIALPDDPRGVEIRLARFAEALKAAQAKSTR
jgi:hypothetical protein